MTVDQYLQDLYNNVDNLWGVLCITIFVAFCWLLILSVLAHAPNKDRKSIALLEGRVALLEADTVAPPARPTVKSALENGIHELASVEKWRSELIAQHGALSPEMEDLFGEYRRAVRDRSVTRFERELAEIMGMEVQR